MSSAAPKPPVKWTTRALLAWMAEAFTSKGLDAPRLSAEMLLSHVIGCDRLKLYTDADRPASPLERGSLRDLVARALKDEPVQYLVGEKWFYGMPFKVDGRVLIPRSSTETIIEEVLLHARAEPGFGGKTGEGVRLADVCTGSGCVAIALLKNLPKARALASDIAPDALEVARVNAERHRVHDRIEFLEGHLLDPLINHPAGGSAGRDLHYLLSNPPYIPDHEWDAVARNVKEYEPHGALRAGADGLVFIRPIAAQAHEVLRPGGVLMIETAASTAEAVRQLVEDTGQFVHARIANDSDGLARVVIAMRKTHRAGSRGPGRSGMGSESLEHTWAALKASRWRTLTCTRRVEPLRRRNAVLVPRPDLSPEHGTGLLSHSIRCAGRYTPEIHNASMSNPNMST